MCRLIVQKLMNKSDLLFRMQLSQGTLRCLCVSHFHKKELRRLCKKENLVYNYVFIEKPIIPNKSLLYNRQLNGETDTTTGK
jgi:hypothetical protein